MDFSFASNSPPFFNDNDIMNNASVFYDNNLAEIEASWNQNIDPQLRSRQPAAYQSWHNQQQPMQRFINARENSLYTATSFQSYHPTAVLPCANKQRMVSPAPSQDITSICSSARSPRPDVEDRFNDQSYYSPQSQQNDFLPSPANLPSQNFDFWGGQNTSFPASNHVNMSQVQSFADPQDLFFEQDEGYIENSQDFKTEYVQDNNTHLHAHDIKDPIGHQGFHYPNDEGLGASIKDASSTVESPASHHSDPDADGEAEDDDAYIKPETELDAEEIVGSDEDEEYKPRSARTRKRRASYTFKASPSTKRARVTKPLNKSRKAAKYVVPTGDNSTSCPTCGRADFKDSTALQKHINGNHLRPYTCVFSFAGCPSTFASKNEWKRHVSTQHLNLHAWICTQGQCGKVFRSGPGGGRGSEFNRKDLFTQHARRMHVPGGVKNGKGGREWEETLKGWQSECMIVKRSSPLRLACPVPTCGGTFEGKMAWDERMEHVAKHLERVATKGGQDVRQGDDELLVAWAVKEGIVVKTVNGGYRFPREGEVIHGIDVDADGDDE